MDPRNSAKVTAPDLLEAFHESAPRQDGDADKSNLRIFVVLVDNENVSKASDYPLREMSDVMVEITLWLQKGHGFGAFLIVDDTAPQLFIDAAAAVDEPALSPPES